MDNHGLHDWRFDFDNARRRFGRCRYRDRTITLSQYFVALNDESEVGETVRHEIAHALAGPNTGHGQAWVDSCATVGAKPIRCYDAGDREVVTPPGSWTVTCPRCGVTFTRHRRARGRFACMDCNKKDGSVIELKWKKS